jgi:hypothetical protein
MISTYRIVTDSGNKAEIRSPSAATAIEDARWLFRGQKIVQCYTGMKQADVDFLRMVDRDARPSVGYIDHEIPPHEPIPEDAVKPKTRGFKDTVTMPMFDDEKIKSESERAKSKFEQA